MESGGPRARTTRLVTRDLGDELLVYDLERHKAYCLNRVAMEVFRHCDGETTIPDMALRIGDALGLPVDERSRPAWPRAPGEGPPPRQSRGGDPPHFATRDAAHAGQGGRGGRAPRDRDHRSYVGASCQPLLTIRQPLHWSGAMLPRPSAAMQHRKPRNEDVWWWSAAREREIPGREVCPAGAPRSVADHG